MIQDHFDAAGNKRSVLLSSYVQGLTCTYIQYATHLLTRLYVTAKNGETSVYKELAQVVTKHYGPNPPENVQ